MGDCGYFSSSQSDPDKIAHIPTYMWSFKFKPKASKKAKKSWEFCLVLPEIDAAVSKDFIITVFS